MVVMHAERFGLSQLHQLRGRVGRGDKRSLCVACHAEEITDEAAQRLEAFESSNDGFHLAAADLEIRGPGEFLGTRQAGAMDKGLADIVRHGDILLQARKAAEQVLKGDPSLSEENHRRLAEELERRFHGSLKHLSSG
jgi:ATP-dependent DNA helicase RecG